jgi:hypothetical protein
MIESYQRGFEDGLGAAPLIGLQLPQSEQGPYYLGVQDGRQMAAGGCPAYPWSPPEAVRCAA